MDIKTDRFRQILQWLKKNRGVGTQEELAKSIGVNINTISRARSGKRLPTDDLLMRIKEEFNLPFELSWMRADDLTTNTGSSLHPSIVEMGTKSIVDLYAQLIKEVEELRCDLTEELSEIRILRSQLTEDRDALRTIANQLKDALYSRVSNHPFMVADSDDSEQNNN